ncbi:hypothetical protein [Paenibacillus dakarensis]|uniref:hypothetical protein n=1 Tax=Paenibacillus dakarensis TaxID=1527293 RepID=UPI0006D547EB|nr:hypothetical protein [Paenibacillus dakarensis]
MNKPRLFTKTMLAFILLTCNTSFYYSSQTAHAGYFDDVYNNFKEFSELPGEIDEMKNSYQRALEELDRARLDAELYQKQNAELAEQNKQLTKMVEQLQQAETARSQRAERIKTAVITALILLAGYFIFTRVLRYGMRSRNKRF